MNLRFAVAAICGLGVALFVPPLLPFAAIGILIGVAPAAVGRITRHRRRPSAKRPAAVAGIVVATIVTLAASFGLFATIQRQSGGNMEAEAPLTILVSATYGGTAVQRDGPERLDLTDRLRISNSSLARTASELGRHGGGVAGRAHGARSHASPVGWLTGALEADLRTQGWDLTEKSTEGLVFERARTVRLRIGKLPPETGVEIGVPHVVASTLGVGRLELRFDRRSRLTLTAPPGTFGPSFPAGDRQTRPVADLETLSIPVASTRIVELDIRSPWFRNELLEGLADLTALGVVKVVIGFLFSLLIAFFSDGIRDFLKRALKRGKQKPVQPDPPQPSG